jgi:hypothetical protein
MSSQELVACYRLYAANCVEIAREISEPNRKLALLSMAEAWIQMANQLVKHANPVLPSPTEGVSQQVTAAPDH